ncbi:MAG: hypothetical protein ACLQUY_16760 [Ktedonobacterales bacterium]
MRDFSVHIYTAEAEPGLLNGVVRLAQRAEQPGGGEVGWFTDKFGINWMVSVDRA